MMVKEEVFQLLIFLLFPHRNNYIGFIHIQKTHLQIHLTLITHMHGQRMEGEGGIPQHLNLELMEEIMINHQVEDHQMDKIQQKVLILREKGLFEDMIGKHLTQEHLEVDLQEIPQEVEEDMEEMEDHLEEDPLEEVEDPQEEEDLINLKVLDLSIYLLTTLIQN